MHELGEALQEKQAREKDTKGDVDRLLQESEAIKKEISEIKSSIEKQVGILMPDELVELFAFFRS